jgi:hypothetical protein
VSGAHLGDAAVEADVARLVAEHPLELQAIEAALRRALRAAAPTMVERVDFNNKLIAFGWSMAMRDLLFAIICHKSWVNLQLADGADLPDPGGLVEGTGKRIRHVKVRSVAAAADPHLRALIAGQVALQPARRG